MPEDQSTVKIPLSEYDRLMRNQKPERAYHNVHLAYMDDDTVKRLIHDHLESTGFCVMQTYIPASIQKKEDIPNMVYDNKSNTFSKL